MVVIVLVFMVVFRQYRLFAVVDVHRVGLNCAMDAACPSPTFTKKKLIIPSSQSY